MVDTVGQLVSLADDLIDAIDDENVGAIIAKSLEVIDVDSDAGLKSRYGERVPVLLAGGQEICHYHFDPVALGAYFAKIR